jgi:hypothetical protein
VLSLRTAEFVDVPGAHPELDDIISAYEWIADVHNETNTSFVDWGKRFLIGAASNSKLSLRFFRDAKKNGHGSKM